MLLRHTYYTCDGLSSTCLGDTCCGCTGYGSTRHEQAKIFLVHECRSDNVAVRGKCSFARFYALVPEDLSRQARYLLPLTASPSPPPSSSPLPVTLAPPSPSPSRSPSLPRPPPSTPLSLPPPPSPLHPAGRSLLECGHTFARQPAPPRRQPRVACHRPRRHATSPRAHAPRAHAQPQAARRLAQPPAFGGRRDLEADWARGQL